MAWDVHVYAFKRMLPFLFMYDHANYARWSTANLAEMTVLTPEILHEFQVAKRYRKEEWWLVGITRVASALSRLTMSYTLRTVIASQTTAIPRLTTAKTFAYLYEVVQPSKGKQKHYESGQEQSTYTHNSL